MNHIATSRSHSPRENYSLLIIGISNGDEDGGGVDGDPSGGTSPSRQTSVPRNLGFDVTAAAELFWRIRASGVFYYETTLNNFLCRFREYFLCNFFGIKNSRKQELALWHLVNM